MSFGFREKRYHHATGCLGSLLHASNPDFAEAIRHEKSESIAREMADPTRVAWADIDLGKRQLTPAEIDAFERVKERLEKDIVAAPPRAPAVTAPPQARARRVGSP
jgi:hypothetical protein